MTRENPCRRPWPLTKVPTSLAPRTSLARAILARCAWFGLAVALSANCGCVGLLAQMSYWTGAGLVPAEYDKLEGKRIAVVCLSSNSSYGVGVEAEELAHGVSDILKARVKDAEIVSQDDIADWVDQNDWNELDYREVGRGVKAECLVAIDVSGFRLYEGPSLYSGRATVTVTVLDITDGGKEVFRRKLPEIKYPEGAVYPSSESSEQVFRSKFIAVISKQVARYFYSYDPSERYGRDPASLD